jgi:hypothetical protein
MGNSGSAAARRERLAEQRARHAQGPVAADHYGQGIQPDDSFLRPGAGGQGNRTPAPSTEKRTVKVKNEMRMLKGSLRLRPVADGRGGGRYSIEFKVIIVARNACTRTKPLDCNSTTHRSSAYKPRVHTQSLCRSLRCSH